MHRVAGVVFETALRILFGSSGVHETREDAAKWLMQREVKFVYQPAVIVEFGRPTWHDAAE